MLSGDESVKGVGVDVTMQSIEKIDSFGSGGRDRTYDKLINRRSGAVSPVFS